ncbi:dihydrofolate reductase family protein [Nocardia crassostreae]|uniref:dihydrofolate reductase family protein n=1 Tax=Nocardia crassostreae TaxID=53428 RepID=UPI0008296AB2|nr:dihydrofolate reductase family protein [Nocardia crassostreae]
MRAVVLHMMVSVDGFTQGPGGVMDWIEIDDPDFHEYLGELLDSVDGQIFGRVCYEELGEYWPQAEREPTAPGDELASRVNGLPKYVVSHGRRELAWQPAVRIGDDLAAEVNALKERPGKPLVLFGGATTAQEFLRLGLVDELSLAVFPVLLGFGQRFFAPGPRSALRLVQAREFPKSGVVLQRYRR